jgi:hypothetical protein
MTLDLRLSLDEAAERIKALDVEGSSNAFEMGDIALAAVPIVETEFDETTEGQAFAGSAGQFKDQGVTATLKELADKAGVSWKTIKNRRFVSARVPVALRKATGGWWIYHRIANVPDPDHRAELLDLVSRPNPEREDGRWTEAALRPYLPKRPSVGSAPKDSLEEALLRTAIEGYYQEHLNRNDWEALQQLHREMPEVVRRVQARLDVWFQRNLRDLAPLMAEGRRAS